MPVAVTTSLTFDAGFGWENLQSFLNETISDYLKELRTQWGGAPYLVVRASQIETRILEVKGVVDVQDTRLNGIAGNLTLSRFQVPVFGGAGE